jgi:hypothetical protein
VEKFKALAAGTLREYEDMTAEDSLKEQAKILLNLRDNYSRALNPMKPKTISKEDHYGIQ